MFNYLEVQAYLWHNEFNKLNVKEIITMSKNYFFVKHPVLAAFLIPMFGLLFMSLLNIFTGQLPEVPGQLALALLIFLLLLLHRLIYRADFRGCFCSEALNDRRFLRLVCIALLIDIIIPTVIGVFIRHNSFKLSYIANGLQAGCCEEIIFRALPVSVMMAAFKDRKSYVPVLLLGSLLFGFTHLTNLLGDASLGATILQIFSASASGLLFCSIYIYSGNILIPIVMHSIHDVIAFLELGSDAALSIAITPQLLLEEGLYFVVEIIISVLILKGRKEQIQALWNRLWSAAAPPQ